MPEVLLRRVLAATVAWAGLVSGALLGASPAAADSFGWDSGTRCNYPNGHFSVVKIQWRYKYEGGEWLYNPYAVHVLESDGAHHQTFSDATMTVIYDGTVIATQRDHWSGPTTYTFGPTRLYNAKAYTNRSRIQERTELRDATGSHCVTNNGP